MLGEASNKFHPTEELLEEYIFGRVGTAALKPLEEHLLFCDQCQAKVKETDEFARVWKAGAASYRESRTSALRHFLSGAFVIPRFRPFGALIACGLVLAVVGTTLTLRSPRRASEVQLTALRGGENQAFATGPASGPLNLSLDAASLPSSTGYRLELVDQSGRTLWTGQGILTGTRLSAAVSNPGAGIYWIRVYARSLPNSQENLLREFGLRLR